MKVNNEYRNVFIVISIVFIAGIIISLSVGRYVVSFSEVVRILVSFIFQTEGTQDLVAQGVVLNLRLPRVLGAILVGSSLAISGACYQGVFKNQLVSPDILGVSSGATVGAAIAILLGGDRFMIQIGAFLGGIAAVLLTMMIPKLLKNTSTMLLVLSGIIVGGLMGSIIGIIKFLADPDEQLAEIVYWQMGSLAKVNLPDVLGILPIVVIATVILLSLSWRINILTLGDQEAQLSGVNVKMIRSIVIICATMLTASSVSISGTIGWLGLVIPHLARILIGPDNVKVFPISLLLGSIFLVTIDTLARVLTTAELPLSILTGLIGAPFYFWILSRQRVRL
ncbi:FecCD family ABC transporter permease [Dehalobacterium formicoaceticum]|uniref:Iron ABC transporter permease n=1 Tax=Dehalobacterium formicoaceticum TaxID=51515 RepID=A0ABT1Y7S1_9FIRM|nr:iron ABC transporter permease [Dehalobacterium formicoaceticum]MCR6546928.1 iron ABC transporter permease [Dehalobacterium formicoaceticum]